MRLHHCIVIRVFPSGSSVVPALITRVPGGGTVLRDLEEPSLLSGTRRCEAEEASCGQLEPGGGWGRDGPSSPLQAGWLGELQEAVECADVQNTPMRSRSLTALQAAVAPLGPSAQSARVSLQASSWPALLGPRGPQRAVGVPVSVLCARGIRTGLCPWKVVRKCGANT